MRLKEISDFTVVMLFKLLFFSSEVLILNPGASHSCGTVCFLLARWLAYLAFSPEWRLLTLHSSKTSSSLAPVLKELAFWVKSFSILFHSCSHMAGLGGAGGEGAGRQMMRLSLKSPLG